jgi:membrane fusion protein, multidrug efflux system
MLRFATNSGSAVTSVLGAPVLGLLALGLLAGACGGGGPAAGGARGDGTPVDGTRGDGTRGDGARGNGGFPGGGFGGRESTAVPVEVTPVERRDMASYIETNGTLEAEAEVDLVARTSGPIVELLAEENMTVREGQLLARLDQREIRARLEIAQVNLAEAQTAFARAEALQRASLLSSEEFEQARSRLDSARAEALGNEIQLGYTEIKAPFAGLIVRRYVKFAENVAVNQPLFRLSDFDPLLCPIQVPERELPRLATGQKAYVTVDSWPGERFAASVLRVSPVVEAATGTVRVTLEMEAQGKLRPGMFGSVFLQTDTHEGVLAVLRKALALDSIGDAVFVAQDGTAVRRDVTLGVREGDLVEVVAGLGEGDLVVTVGQDSLSDGTPISVPGAESAAGGGGERRAEGGAEFAGPGGAPGTGGFEMTPERLEAIEARMRERGLSDQEIEQRLRQMRERAGQGAPAGAADGDH